MVTKNIPILQHCVQASKVFGFSSSIGILHWTEASAVTLDCVPNSFQTYIRLRIIINQMLIEI